MEALLMDKYISHYNLPRPNLTNFVQETEDTYFEIEDTNLGEIVVHNIVSSGVAKFKNPRALKIKVVNYDKFVTSIRDVSFTNNRQRCDIVVSCNTNSNFILGELKDRNPKKRVRRKAKKQLLDSLQTLMNVPDIRTYINSKTIKRCCYFNKQSNSPGIINATTAFNRQSNVNLNGFKMNSPEIEAFGFEFYEYTGSQQMTLV